MPGTKYIQRFSEDVDDACDIRRMIPEQIGIDGDPIPKTRSAERRWSSLLRRLLPEWVAETAYPNIAKAFAAEALAVEIRVNGERLIIDYEATHDDLDCIEPNVIIEFGARSTGEPARHMEVTCDAACLIKGLEFPTARPRVMLAERTCWEKMMAVHVYCFQERLRANRFSRHCHDIVRLDDAGIAENAFADRKLAVEVARHQQMFFPMKAVDRERIDYLDAVNGGLQLVPYSEALQVLKEDYERMVAAGLFLEQVEPFEVIMERCADIAKRANRAVGKPK